MRKEVMFDKCMLLFKCAFIIAMLISAVPYLHEIVSPYFKILLIPAAALITADFFMGRQLWKTRHLVWLIAFAAAYFVTIVVNRDSHFIENSKALAYMGVIFLVMYGSRAHGDAIKSQTELRVVYHTFLGGAFILSLISFLTYCLSYNVKYMIGESRMHIGLYDNRLWGLYNPNTGATLCSLSILILSAFLLENRKKRKVVVAFYIVDLILQSMCLILTSSRAPIAATIVGVVVIVGYRASVYAHEKTDEKTGHKMSRDLLVTGVTMILSLGLILGGIKVAQYGLSYVPPALKTFPLSGPNILKDYVTLEEEKKVDLTRKEKEEERAGGLLTGRTDLWQAGFKGFRASPIVGLGREGIYDACKDYLEDDIWENSLDYGGLHNIYLTVLASSGIVGTLLLGIFVILTLKDMLVYGLRRKGFCSNILFLCNFIMLFSFAVTEMMEARILYRVGIFYIMFWIIYGYCEAEAAPRDVQKE